MFLIYKPNKFEEGISVIEIVVVVAIITIALTSLLGLASFSLGISSLIKQTNQANDIARETMEAVRNFRDGTIWNTNGLGALATSTDFYPQATGTPSGWQLNLGTQIVDSFSRKVVFEDVMRDGNFNIVTTGGTNDPDTKKVTVTVSWQERGRSHQVKLVSYLTNWQK